MRHRVFFLWSATKSRLDAAVKAIQPQKWRLTHYPALAGVPLKGGYEQFAAHSSSGRTRGFQSRNVSSILTWATLVYAANFGSDRSLCMVLSDLIFSITSSTRLIRCLSLSDGLGFALLEQ